MNSRAFTLSLIIAGLAMFMVYSYIEGEKGKYIRIYGQNRPVVVAKVDIKELDLLDDSKVSTINIPQAFVAPQALRDPKEVFNTIASVPILKGEQITRPRITIPGARTGLARQVSLGRRAMSISVDNTQSVSRLIKPGDRVDIIALIDYAGGQKDMLKVKTVLQDILVLSTGLSVTNSLPLVGIESGDKIREMKLATYTNYDTVTLELDPFQVQKLIFLIGNGARPYLSLRNNDDKQIVRIKGTRIFDLLGEDAPEAKAYFSDQKKK